MGCLTIIVSRTGGMEATAVRTGGISTSVERQDYMETSTQRIGGMAFTQQRIGGMTATAVMVCAVAPPRLKVRPIETQWVDVDLEVLYDIVYPRDWRIE